MMEVPTHVSRTRKLRAHILAWDDKAEIVNLKWYESLNSQCLPPETYFLH